MISWGYAGFIAGVGFGLVFFVLAILATAVLVYGFILRRLEKRKE